MVIDELFPNVHKKIPTNYSPHGKPDYAIFRDYVFSATGKEPTQNELEIIKEKYLKALPLEMERSRDKYKVLSGVKELLEFISEDGGLIGLGTGNLKEAAEIKLRPSGLLHFFSFGGYGSDSVSRAEILKIAIKRGSEMLSEEVEPEDVVFFGDTLLDIDAVQKVGGKIVAVATGINSINELAMADLAVEDLSDRRVREFLL